MYLCTEKLNLMNTYILADNQDLTRYAVESLLRQDGGNTICRATDKMRLIELLKTYENAVVVLDYKLFDFIDENQMLIISERFAMAAWVLVSDELTERFLRRVIYTSHVFSVVFKDSPVSEMREALRAAARHDRFICQRAMALVLAHADVSEEDRHNLLTATETEIVKAIAQGKTTKEIAAERYLSVHTVTTHRKNIFRKLGVNTAHEVVKYALRAGWVNPAEFYI